MTDLATLTKQGDVSIIKLDDGKANAFSLDMLESLNACLAEVPRDSGSLIITGREGLFSCLLYTSPSPRDKHRSRMPSSA